MRTTITRFATCGTGLRIDQILVLFAITQCGYRDWSNVAMVCSSGGTLERVGHTDEFGVIPCAAEKLNGDRLPVIVEPGRHDDGWNAVRCAWCVPPAEARSWSTSIVYADLAQQSRIDDRVNTGMAGTRGIQPHLHDGLARYAIIPLRLDFGGCHPRRRRCGATRCIRSHICNFLLRAIHVHGAGDFKSLSGQLGMAVNVLHPSDLTFPVVISVVWGGVSVDPTVAPISMMTAPASVK